jgi:hypothetical protein
VFTRIAIGPTFTDYMVISEKKSSSFKTTNIITPMPVFGIPQKNSSGNCHAPKMSTKKFILLI